MSDEIEVTRSKTAKNIRVIVPLDCGDENEQFVFKNPSVLEVIERMALKIRFLEAERKRLEAVNIELAELASNLLEPAK